MIFIGFLTERIGAASEADYSDAMHRYLSVLQPEKPPAGYSGLNLNQYSVASPCRTICTVCGSPPCPDFC
ncbi:hypothetical protein ACFX50_06890 [Neisseria meningitidis]